MANAQMKMQDSPEANNQPLVIFGQYLKDLSFENPNPLAIFNTENTRKQPEIGVDARVEASPVGNEEDKVFEVTLGLTASIKIDNDPLCITEVSYACLVKVNQNLSHEEMGHLLMVQCPTMVFPFARLIIADTTRSANFPPLILDAIDFEKMYMEQQSKKH